MNHLATLLVNGVSLGCLDALIALGFVLVFKATRVVNFAYGSLLLLGAYVIGRTHDGLGFPGAVLLAVAVTAAVALVVGVVVLRPARLADPGTLAILTLGVDIVLATELTRRIGTDLLTTGDPWGARVVTVAGIQVPQTRVAAAADLDGTLFVPVGPIAKPVLLVGSQRPDDPSWVRDLAGLTGWKRWLTVTGSGHMSFTDRPVLGAQLGLDPGAIPADRQLLITREYLAAFLDRHLRGRPAPLLDGPAAAYPEVVFHTD
ncbi:hypothetical protein ACFQ0D_25015 [Micromonospora zhanjiangensis]